jgi:hypothetical protein
MPTVTCTPGGTADNSYVTEAQAAAYFAADMREQAWVDFGTDRQQRALLQATRELEALGGARVHEAYPQRVKFWGTPYLTTQALHFPRTEDATTDPVTHALVKVIPEPVRQAVCEQAYWLAERQTNGGGVGDLIDFKGLQAEGVVSFSMDGISATMISASGSSGIAPVAWVRFSPFVRKGARMVCR